MYILDIIQNEIFIKIDLAIILLVISVGELVKRYWKNKKVNSFFRVLFTTLPITIIYAYLGLISPEKTLLSYLVAFWLYPLIIKPILILLKIKKTSKSSSVYVGGEIPNTDDEN